MATTLPPKKNTAYNTEVCLVSQSDTDIFQTSVTLAAGDVLVYQDGVLDGNIDTLPSEIGSSGVLVLALSADEMNCDRVAVKFSDAAGDEWQDLIVTIHTTSRHINDLAYPNTTGRGMDVDASGGVEVGSFQTDAITADSLKADAVTEIETGVWTYGTRTLTTSSASGSSISGSTVTIHRGDSLSVAITDLGSIAGRSKLWFTVKTSLTDTDAESIIQIEETAGLVYLNGADASARAANGDITVDDEDDGDITITLDEVETDDLVINKRLYYDVQVLNSGDVNTLTQSLCRITADVSRVVA